MRILAFLIFALFILVPLQSYAETVTHQWSKRLGGGGDDYGQQVITDENGYSYLVGSISGTGDLNGDGDTGDALEISASPYGDYDILISAFDSNGNNLWYKRLGGGGFDNGDDLGIDASGNFFVIGYVAGNADFNGDGDTSDLGETVASPYGVYDILLSAFDSNGNNLWYKRLGGSDLDAGIAVTVDDSGNIAVTGIVGGDSDLNGDGDTGDALETSASPYGGFDTFVSVFDSDGNNLWYKRLGGSGGDNGFEISVDTSNNIFITGSIEGTADINGDGDTGDIDEVTASPYGDADIFVSAFDSGGNSLWYKRLGGPGGDLGDGITTDISGNVFVAGYVGGAADLNGDGDTADALETQASPYGLNDIFVSAFDSSGNNLWYKRLGGVGHDSAQDITTDMHGNTFVTGYVDGTADLNGDGDATDDGETAASPFGSYDIFVSAFDPDGGSLLQMRLGGESYDFGYGVAFDTSGDVFLTGVAIGTADLNNDGDALDSVEISASPYGGYDAFITSFNISYPVEVTEAPVRRAHNDRNQSININSITLTREQLIAFIQNQIGELMKRLIEMLTKEMLKLQ